MERLIALLMNAAHMHGMQDENLMDIIMDYFTDIKVNNKFIVFEYNSKLVIT